MIRSVNDTCTVVPCVAIRYKFHRTDRMMFVVSDCSVSTLIRLCRNSLDFKATRGRLLAITITRTTSHRDVTWSERNIGYICGRPYARGYLRALGVQVSFRHSVKHQATVDTMTTTSMHVHMHLNLAALPLYVFKSYESIAYSDI